MRGQLVDSEGFPEGILMCTVLGVPGNVSSAYEMTTNIL